MSETQKYTVIPFKEGRFAIADEAGVTVDDAQGYGYKTKPGAYRAMSYKLQGGKDKKAQQKKQFDDWRMERLVHVEIIGSYCAIVEMNAKQIALKQVKLSAIWAELEGKHNIQVPDFVKKELK